MSDMPREAPSDEMVAHYERRTAAHIALVGRYCDRLAAREPGLAGLHEYGMVHDASKLREPERTPYVWLTWRYRCHDRGLSFTAPPGMEARMRAATEHHVRTNLHHPEAWAPPQAGPLVNPRDRDAVPAQAVDATRMPDLDLAEMCADWCAMAAERGNTPQAWAARVVGPRWRFTAAQAARIDTLLDWAWDGERQP